MTTAHLRHLAGALSLAILAGCSGGASRPKTVAPPPAATPATLVEIDAAFDQLMAGNEAEARKQIKKLLKRDPMSANARLLDDSINRSPQDLLGPQSFPYTARASDTIVGLAQRFLGNRLKAYQLARYNALRAPVTIVTGQVLRIPGEPPRLEPPHRAEPAPPRPGPATPPSAAPRTKIVSPKPAAPVANPAAARAARAAGLAALNGGQINRAVGLLRRATSLDPGNPLIARDLARAERIAATVRARK